jgi:hypothetical protein
MSLPDLPDKLDVELLEVPVQVRSVFPRRTKVTLRSVAGRVGVYRTDDDESLLGLLNSDLGLEEDDDLGRYEVEIRSVRRPIADATAPPARRSAEQDDCVPHSTSATSADNGGSTRIIVRVTRPVPDRGRGTPNDAFDRAQNGDAQPVVVEVALSRLLDEGVEIFSEDELLRLAGNVELRGALGPGTELVQWIDRVVEAKSFDEKCAVVRDLMGPAGGRSGELVQRMLDANRV